MWKRFPQLVALEQKKGRHFERFTNSERAVEGARIQEIEQVDKIVPAHSAQQVEKFQDLQALQPPG